MNVTQEKIFRSVIIIVNVGYEEIQEKIKKSDVRKNRNINFVTLVVMTSTDNKNYKVVVKVLILAYVEEMAYLSCEDTNCITNYYKNYNESEKKRIEKKLKILAEKNRVLDIIVRLLGCYYKNIGL